MLPEKLILYVAYLLSTHCDISNAAAVKGMDGNMMLLIKTVFLVCTLFDNRVSDTSLCCTFRILTAHFPSVSDPIPTLYYCGASIFRAFLPALLLFIEKTSCSCLEVDNLPHCLTLFSTCGSC